VGDPFTGPAAERDPPSLETVRNWRILLEEGLKSPGRQFRVAVRLENLPVFLDQHLIAAQSFLTLMAGGQVAAEQNPALPERQRGRGGRLSSWRRCSGAWPNTL